MSDNSTPGHERVHALDAARGAAILAVCLSHYGTVVPGGDSPVGRAFVALGLVATPAFLLLSGLISGYTVAAGREAGSRAKLLLADRGLFLLLPAHVLVALAHTPAWGVHTSLFGSFYITDTIGLFLMLVWAVPIDARARVLAPVVSGTYILAWLAHYLPWESPPAAAGFLRVAHAIVAGRDAVHGGYIVPVVEYLCVLVVGFALGTSLHSRFAKPEEARRLAAFWLRGGLALIAAGLCTEICWFAVRGMLHGPSRLPVYETLSVLQKLPPGPAYLLLFGGAACVLLAATFRMASAPSLRHLFGVLVTFGRASLLVFILQFFCYVTLPLELGLASGYARACWLPVSLIVLYAVARAWTQLSGNRFFTVGLRFLDGRAQPYSTPRV